MRLSKIKLSGFKSFVEPTTILLPSNLVGVVGPNGCGKSNVIDAIRWVMGESSAKNLRGDSMTDVIFNGSANRKPVGTASIELYFDNGDGAIGGQFANYGEVSVRRAVSRDGQSQYFLNNVRCRRKDITGIFLGTGLGPRSYSIIEQGMISRLIEARPEEMRAHLEEAAGISKYKERRRETENRIRHTRDNLDRLNDLREEVENHLKHLDKQARAAERHKESKEEQRHVEAELLALNLREADAKIADKRLELERQQTELESVIASQRKIEAAIEQARQQQILASDELNATQARHYSVDLEISHLEHAIEHNRETQQRQSQDLEQAAAQLGELSQEIDDDEAQVKQIDEKLALLTPGIDEVKRGADASSHLLGQTEAELTRWQETWSQFSADLSAARQSVEVEQTRIEQLGLQQDHLQKRESSIAAERSDIDLTQIEDTLADYVRRETELAENEQAQNRAVQENSEALLQKRAEEEVLRSGAEEARGELDASRARLAAMETLQQAALGGDDGTVAEWLTQNHLDQSQRLAQRLKVDGPWQQAVEAVLGDFLQAVSVDELDNLLGKLPEANVLLYSGDALRYAEDSGPGFLLAHVRNAGPAADMLAKVRTATNLDEAMRVRSQLAAGESVITPDGIWISRTWVRISRRDAENGGVLRRETEMRDLEVSIRSAEQALKRTAEQRQHIGAEIEALEQASKQLQESRALAGKAHGTAAAELASVRNELDKSRQRTLALGQDTQTVEADIGGVAREIDAARQRLAEASQQVESLGSKEAALKAEQAELLAELDNNRQQADENREQFQALVIELESRRSSRESASTTLERALAQKMQLEERVAALKNMVAEGEQPLNDLQEQLQGTACTKSGS